MGMTLHGIMDIDVTKLVLPFSALQALFEDGEAQVTCLTCQSEITGIKLVESLMGPYEVRPREVIQVGPYNLQALTVAELQKLIDDASEELSRRVEPKDYHCDGQYDDTGQLFSHVATTETVDQAIEQVEKELATGDPVVQQVRVGSKIVWGDY